mmetsp:Transcript_121601/g.355377  ORF Transcript_121601/g.355377 Transcript_121601/m.355377 type:complete len:266 (+) Transcript_121601:160-957(+)
MEPLEVESLPLLALQKEQVLRTTKAPALLAQERLAEPRPDQLPLLRRGAAGERPALRGPAAAQGPRERRRAGFPGQDHTAGGLRCRPAVLGVDADLTLRLLPDLFTSGLCEGLACLAGERAPVQGDRRTAARGRCDSVGALASRPRPLGHHCGPHAHLLLRQILAGGRAWLPQELRRQILSHLLLGSAQAGDHAVPQPRHHRRDRNFWGRILLHVPALGRAVHVREVAERCQGGRDAPEFTLHDNDGGHHLVVRVCGGGLLLLQA